MRFSKHNQPRRRNGGRKPDPNSKAGQRRAEQARAERAEERAKFAEFLNAESGYFNGFDFCDFFHNAFDKGDALEVLTSDDCGDVTIHAGADGVTVYIMTERARTGEELKIVRFNRSVYIF